MIPGDTDRKIDKLIQLLAKNATLVVPGPKIAAEIGVTRATVWMWIERLRALGVEIKGFPSSGYQLQTLPDILAPSLVRPELGDCEIGRRIVHYFRVDSTNSVALEMAAKGETHGTVVVAEEQTAGRGRLGRSWYSEKTSGIYVSVILRPPLAPAAAPVLTLVAGLAAHQALTSVTGLPVDIRWPNDILLGCKKLGGILTEMSAEMDRLHAVVIGLGLNINHRAMPAELKEVATSLRIEGGRSYARVPVLVALLKELEWYYRLLLAEGSAAVAQRWTAASTFAEGKRVKVRLNSDEFEATTAGLETNGALRIRRGDGREQSLVSGEIVEVK